MDENAITEIERVIEELEVGGMPAHEVPAAYAAIQALRARADRLERDLIRALRWDAAGKPVRTWEQVARVVDAQLGSRQAAHARWGRLKRGDELRQPSGAAVPRSRRSTPDTAD